MNLPQRLIFLEQRRLIDQEVNELVLTIRDYLQQEWRANVETAQAGMLFIHLAMALARIKRGYEAEALHQDIYAEMESAVTFPKVLQRHQELLRQIPFPIPESEQTHFIANIYSLSLAQPQILET
ncbi:hypothetical protein [Caviibacterium pharyngocola]|uniref:PRD domain-containing protein n=1 Tax=Caviibacterium pharyngocola TaxID=28159 RepID=A0A2M8RXL8_9PAST|nr:hypothetical protein [Caviibacterium pharyngocola]PJG83635.1 hypothetical protein CVP04_03080 [Caviibacterium pharyngocola]